MNNLSPGMKAVMLPIKEPSLAQKLRRGASLEDLVEKEVVDHTIPPFSSQDLPSVGRQSDLDLWFGQETKLLEEKEKQERVVPEREANRADSGGSDHIRNNVVNMGTESSLEQQPSVQIAVTSVEQEEQKD